MKSLITLTPKQLRRAADLQERIVELQDELSEILGTPDESAAPVVKAPKRRGRKPKAVVLVDAPKKRGRKARVVAQAEAPKKKRTMSEAGRASVRKAQLERWAKIKAEKKA